MRKTILFVLILTILFASNAIAGADRTLFPRPAAIEPAVQFWTKVFTEIDGQHGYLHDDKHLDVIYKVLVLTKYQKKGKQSYIKKEKKRIKKILITLAKGKRTGLTKEERRILHLWPRDVSNKTLKSAVKRLRFQLGQADKFKAGYIRSGAWRTHILTTLKDMDLPLEIAALPHVESSFNPNAYSKVGAAGLWQFTRSTGKRFMRVDHVVDERMDPFKASVAAARLLQTNHEILGTWPLAITAYNHGAAGMRKAAATVGTTDIDKIIQRYRSRSFKFASRNFYAAFLAVNDVQDNVETYFGKLKQHRPVEDHVVTLPYYISVDTLAKTLGISKTTLKQKNPALRSAVWKNSKYVPKGYSLRLAANTNNGSANKAIQKISKSKRYSKQKRDVSHRVRRGQNLSSIAARYGVRVSDIVAMNGLRSRHRIRVGQVLRLPGSGNTVKPVRLAKSTQKSKRKMRSKAKSKAQLRLANKDGFYKVRKGDNLIRIAKRHNVHYKQLVAMNSFGTKKTIYPGQMIRITSKNGVTPSKDKGIAVAKTKNTPTKPKTTLAKRDSNEVTAPKEIPKVAVLDSALAAPEQERVLKDTSEQIATSTVRNETEVRENFGLEPEDDDITVTALLADPSDYSVASNRTIEIHAAETLGHYAEWLGVRASQLRRLNKIRYGTPVVIGKRIKLDFAKVSPDAFEKQRREYHRGIQETYFEQFQIAGAEDYKIQRGDKLWVLAKRKYKIPVWLLRQYNPALRFDKLRPGVVIKFPTVKERNTQPVRKSA